MKTYMFVVLQKNTTLSKVKEMLTFWPNFIPMIEGYGIIFAFQNQVYLYKNGLEWCNFKL